VEYFTNGFCGQLYLTTGVQWRLPSEAEWEYAARGGVHMNSLNSGVDYDYAGSNTLNDVAWHFGNSSSGIQIVGEKDTTALGVYDMSGNIYEWCSDWYDNGGAEGYSEAVADQDNNPVGALLGVNRVLRGGSYYNNLTISPTAGVRVSYRFYRVPAFTNAYYGFRLSCSSNLP
jgi:formylglycine-generating enzyme required for sulfatase activity